MVISIIKRFYKELYLLAITTLAASLLCFKTTDDPAALVSWTNRCLTECFDPAGETKLKKYEISLSPDLFLRLRKTYANGKQEYYSFKINRFKDIDYLGTTATGTLQLKTDDDDIISQTYNDPKGNIDDMVSQLNLPVKHISPERLDSLRNTLLSLRAITSEKQ